MKADKEPTQNQYFPAGIFNEKPEADGFTSSWYASTLLAFKEPSLWELSKSEKLHAYRFLLIPSLECDYDAVVVWLSIEANGTASLIAKVAGETGARERSVSAEETAAFLLIVETTKFWDLPTKEKRLGLDGADWITEGTRKGDYHVVSRWCSEKGSYRELGLHFLLKLAKLNLPDDDVPE